MESQGGEREIFTLLQQRTFIDLYVCLLLQAHHKALRDDVPQKPLGDQPACHTDVAAPHPMLADNTLPTHLKHQDA